MMNLSIQDKIQLSFDYALALRDGKVDYKKAFGDAENVKERNLGYALYTYMVNLFDYNGFPEVIPDEAYNSNDDKEFYRGVKDREHNANFLCDYDYHYGIGKYCNGTYFTTFYPVAYSFGNLDRKAVLSVKLKPDAKILTNRTLEDVFMFGSEDCFGKEIENIKLLCSLLEKVESTKDRDYLSEQFKSDPALLGIVAGADAIQLYQEGEYFSVLNRASIVVKESDFRHICYTSKNYKDGIINFDNKYKGEEFLNE